MLNVSLSHNFLSFLILKFIDFIICSCLHNLTLKLIFNIDFSLFYSCRDRMHVLVFEKSDSDVINKIINNYKKISLISERFYIVVSKIHVNELQNFQNLNLKFFVMLFSLLFSKTWSAWKQFDFQHWYFDYFWDSLIMSMI